MFLEVIGKSVEDVMEINKSKANRIELCINLDCGGTTPKREMIQSAAKISRIPINVIIRENKSLDFVFSEEEKAKMLEDISWIAANTKANGIVIGSLTEDGTLDINFIEEVNKVKGELEVTFHKAFDLLKDKIHDWTILEDLGINNILTSGGDKLDNNFKVIAELSANRKSTNLLIGGGVNKNNINECLKWTNTIHIGTAARIKPNWAENISIQNINEFKK